MWSVGMKGCDGVWTHMDTDTCTLTWKVRMEKNQVQNLKFMSERADSTPVDLRLPFLHWSRAHPAFWRITRSDTFKHSISLLPARWCCSGSDDRVAFYGAIYCGNQQCVVFNPKEKKKPSLTSKFKCSGTDQEVQHLCLGTGTKPKCGRAHGCFKSKMPPRYLICKYLRPHIGGRIWSLGFCL